MTLAQLEYIGAFRDPLPALSTMERMADLFKLREHWGAVVEDAAINELTRASTYFAEIEREIVAVARLIVVEADNGGLVPTV